jgi:WD40 repeat protein
MLRNKLPQALALLVWLAALAAPAADWTWDGVRPSARKPSAAFSSDSQTLALLQDKSVVCIWDVATGKEVKKIPLALGPGEVPERLSYNSTGDLVVLLCKYQGFKFEAGTATQGTISACLWNLASGKRSPFITVGYGGMGICPKGQLLAYDAGLWEIATGNKLRRVPLPEGLVYEIGFSPDGKTVLYQISESLAQDFSLLFLADVATGKKVLQIGEIDLGKQRDGCSFFFGSRFSPDGKWLAFSEEADRPALHLWDVPGGKLLHRIPLKESERVVGFSPDSKTLASWHQSGGSVRLWEVATGKERSAIKVASSVDALLLSPDGKKVALLKGKDVEFRACSK